MHTLQERLDRPQLDRLRRENRQLQNLLDVQKQLLVLQEAEIRRLESKLRAKETPHD